MQALKPYRGPRALMSTFHGPVRPMGLKTLRLDLKPEVNSPSPSETPQKSEIMPPFSQSP